MHGNARSQLASQIHSESNSCLTHLRLPLLPSAPQRLAGVECPALAEPPLPPAEQLLLMLALRAALQLPRLLLGALQH